MAKCPNKAMSAVTRPRLDSRRQEVSIPAPRAWTAGRRHDRPVSDDLGGRARFPRRKAAIVANLYCVAGLCQDREALAIGVARDVLRYHHSRHAAEQVVAGVFGAAVLEPGQAVEMFIHIQGAGVPCNRALRRSISARAADFSCRAASGAPDRGGRRAPYRKKRSGWSWLASFRRSASTGVGRRRPSARHR